MHWKKIILLIFLLITACFVCFLFFLSPVCDARLKRAKFFTYDYQGLKKQSLRTNQYLEKLEKKEKCLKSEGCCESASDCRYFWFAGACYTPENLNEKIKKMPNGNLPGEAIPIKNASCLCQKNICVLTTSTIQ